MPDIRPLDVTRKSLKAQDLAATFADKIVGQDEAREALTEMLEKFMSGMFNRNKPIGSLLFLGPTGSGKTLTAEAFVEGLFGRDSAMLKVDCAEFQHSHEIAKLLGSPPGYLGHRETHPYFTNAALLAARTSLITEKEIMEFTVVLFDEIEKASDALWNLLLGILDKGSLTTGTNEKVDFTKTIIIMTSNVGAGEIANENRIGFDAGAEVADDARLAEIALSAARRKFLPEFLNRIDTVVNFKTLTRKDLTKILEMELQKIQDRIVMDAHTIFEFIVDDSAIKQLLEEGYDKRYNARHLVRAVDKFVAAPLTRLIATSQVTENDVVLVSYDERKKWTYGATRPRARQAVRSS